QRGGDRRTNELLRGHGQEPDREGCRAAARPAQPGRRGKDPPVNDLKDLLELALSDVPGRDARVDPAAVASSRPQPTHSQSGQSAAPDKQARQIKLVAWVGTQPPGYQVAWMPKGWVVQGSTPFSLVIAAPNDKDKSPDSYLGKLVFMLQSRDATAP